IHLRGARDRGRQVRLARGVPGRRRRRAALDVPAPLRRRARRRRIRDPAVAVPWRGGVRPMIALALLAAGVLCWAAGALRRRSWERTARLAELLDLPGEPIVPLGGLSTARLGRVVEVLGLAVRSDGA